MEDTGACSKTIVLAMGLERSIPKSAFKRMDDTSTVDGI